MNYEEALSFIHCTDWKGSQLGLERMCALMHRLGDPQEKLKFVHVAGTNGKGSACTLLASVLTVAGYRTGLYTSPHLVKINERMRIDGADMTDDDLICAAAAVKAAANEMEDAPTEFEIITAMAFWYFARQHCSIVVLEVGLGGRLDATNVIPVPEVAVIMNIGLEHTAELGNTLLKIAREKAGIIKAGGTVVTYPVSPETDELYDELCAARGAKRHGARFDLIREKEHSLSGQSFDWGEYRDVRIRLLGPYQLRNAVMAIETALTLREKGWNITDEALRCGLKNARWEARFELLSRTPCFIADGAHNPQCIEALTDALDACLPGEKVLFLTGMLADKDYREMAARLFPYAKGFVCLTPDSPRALPAEELAVLLRGMGAEAKACDSVEKGIALALTECREAPIVACGSLYMMGEVRVQFRDALKKYQRKTCIAARKVIPPELREAYDRAIVERIANSDLWRQAKTVMSYIAVRGEPSLAGLEALAAQQGKRLCYPYCVSASEMKALYPAGADAWTKGRFDIPEPIPERSEIIPPEEIDLVLCPCTAFDEECHRMGMGAGYYDRYLTKCKNAGAAAVAYETQRISELPAEPWDVPMQSVFTEKRIVKQ